MSDAAEMVPLNIDCGRCGLGLEVEPDSHGRALVYEDEEVVCQGCRTVNQMGVSDDADDGDLDDYGDAIGAAYVSHWTCRHGRDDETPCRWCDLADAWGRFWMRIRRSAMARLKYAAIWFLDWVVDVRILRHRSQRYCLWVACHPWWGPVCPACKCTTPTFREHVCSEGGR